MSSPCSLSDLCVESISDIIDSRPRGTRRYRRCLSAWRKRIPTRLWRDVHWHLGFLNFMRELILRPPCESDYPPVPCTCCFWHSCVDSFSFIFDV